MTTELTPEQVLAGVYDEGAAAYERHWAPALHRHALDLIAAVPPADAGAPRTVVDVASGAGTLVPALRVLAGPEGTVLALDRSRGMLLRAPRSVPRVQADACSLPLADRAADLVAFAFVLFLLPDAGSAVAEAARVLRPGGWLVAATWGDQTGTGADTVVREELDAAAAPPFPPLPRSDELTNTPDRMTSLLADRGFEDVRVRSRPLAATFDAGSALALRTGCGALGWRFARLDASSQETVRRRASERLARLPEAQLVDRSEVLLTVARRP
jgi:ubiquinone/menaquinone biosynthesis C-methylase UbiE